MTTDLPPWESPFVVQAPPLAAEVHDHGDVYRPAARASAVAPLVVLVHGGPLPSDLPRTPRHWPVYRGYGSLVAAAGMTALVVEHPLRSLDDYATAHHSVRVAVEQARADPQVDGSTVAVWLFSGAGPMAAQWLDQPPPWLSCLALSYPILDDRPDKRLPQGFRPVEVARQAEPRVPVVLTRVGQEAPEVMGGVQRFVTAAQVSGLDLRIVEVPDGVHGFDLAEATLRAQQAVHFAVDRVASIIGPHRPAG